MGTELLRQIEKPLPQPVRKTFLPLNETGFNIEDPADFNLREAKVYVAGQYNPQQDEEEFVSVIDYPFGPDDLVQLFNSVAASQFYGMPRSNQKEMAGLRLDRITKFYKKAMTSKGQIPPFHTNPDMKVHKNALTEILKEDSTSPEKVLENFRDHPICLLYSLDILEREFARNYPQPDDFSAVLESLSDTEYATLVKNYGLVTYRGYTEQDQDGRIQAILNIGETQRIDDVESDTVYIDQGNTTVSAQFELIPTPLGEAYALIPQDATLKKYCLPLLHWRTQRGGTTQRTLILDFPSQDIINTFIDPNILRKEATVFQANRHSFNPAVGLSLIPYVDAQKAKGKLPGNTPWTLLTPPYVPILAMIRQVELSQSPLLPSLEQCLDS